MIRIMPWKDPEQERQALLKDIESLRGLYADGTITEGIFHKSMVAVAYHFAAHGDGETALRLVRTIPRSYFVDLQEQHMVEDSDYRLVAYDLALLLVQLGQVHDAGEPVQANMARADA